MKILSTNLLIKSKMSNFLLIFHEPCAKIAELNNRQMNQIKSTNKLLDN